MKYKEYTAKIRYDDSTQTFHGEVIGMRDVITFHGDSVDKLGREFERSIDDYLRLCEERGESPEKPGSEKPVIHLRFEGCCRDWNPLPGHTPPDGVVYEMRCLDTGLFAWGGTIQQAYDRLLKAKQAQAEYDKDPEAYEKRARGDL